MADLTTTIPLDTQTTIPTPDNTRAEKQKQCLLELLASLIRGKLQEAQVWAVKLAAAGYDPNKCLEFEKTLRDGRKKELEHQIRRLLGLKVIKEQQQANG